MAISITGTIVRGEGDAGKNHSVLIPLLAAHFPEIANCSQFGTINVQLDQPLEKSRAHFWTPRVIWNPVSLAVPERSGRVEAFGFIKIQFQCPLSGPIYHAWIMLPEGSTLTYRDDQAEIVTDVFIEGVECGIRCAIHIDHTPSILAPPWFGAFYGMSLGSKNRIASSS